MPTLTIDNRTLTVPDGTNVLEAAKRLGIVIPHFCYHGALGAVGACRLCAMAFLEGPVKGVQMSCMVTAADGMVVSTLDEKAQDLRKSVIEWLMMNHPHDCPVCDEGGECRLQDMTIAGGHGMRRFRGKKRTWQNQQLGPFVEQEMNRCIQCYRCVRTYQDYCGGRDFGVMGSRQRLFFGRFKDGALESPFSGNLVDVCPTGVFTDKTFRYKARLWDLEEAPSICPHCSLGCATIPGARYRELLRTRSGVNEATNGFFICDRGRFGGAYVNHPERPRIPRWMGQERDWDAALSHLEGESARQAALHGPDSIGLLTSSRSGLESVALFSCWAKRLGTEQIAFDPHPGRDRVARQVASLSREHRASLNDVRNSDFALLLGCDPLGEAPMLAPALRQAVRKGGRVFCADPRPLELPFEASRLALPPEALPALLEALESGHSDSLPPEVFAFVKEARAGLDGAKRPVIIGGPDLPGEQGMECLERLAARFSAPGQPCRLFVPLGGPGSFGAALMPARQDFDALLDGIHQGRIRTLVCLEADPFLEAPDPGRVEAALEKLELLVVLDHLPGPAGARAHLLLPTRAVTETGGCFVNNEGRLLPFRPVFEPGIPIRVTGAGDHPPRSFEPGTPGSLPLAAWEILARLLGAPSELGALRLHLARQDQRLAALAEIDRHPEGLVLKGGALPLPDKGAGVPFCIPSGALRLLPMDLPLGSELLSGFSSQMQGVCLHPLARIHPEEGAKLRVGDGERRMITTSLGHLEVIIRHCADMAKGVLALPRIRGTALGDFAPGRWDLWCRIETEAAP